MIFVFDVNGTLSDLGPMGRRFAEVGLPPDAARLWFTAVLRDGIAVSAAGGLVPFADVARGVLRPMVSGDESAVEHVLAGFLALGVHPDVVDGMRALRAAGHQLATLSNGAAAVAEALLGRAGIRELFGWVLSVEDAGRWKPARAAYLHAAHATATAPRDLTMVAVHPWDIDGAARAGLRTAYLDRDGAGYPAHMAPPGRIVRTIAELVS